MPSAACSAALAIGLASSPWPRRAASAALARSGVEPMLVSAMRTSSHEPSAAFLTIAQTPTIAQSSARRVNFRYAEPQPSKAGTRTSVMTSPAPTAVVR